MADFTPIALAVKPVDVATPLMQAARIRQAQVEEQTQRDNQVKQAAGDWARGVAVYAGKPEFAQKWAEGLDDLHNRGLMPTQAYQSLRSTPSPLMLQQIIAQTTSPELAFRQEEAKRAQSNADRQFAESQRVSNRDFALRESELAAKRATEPWIAGPDGSMQPRKGGPMDPGYIESVNQAKDKGIQEQIRERERAVKDRGMDPNDPNTRAYVLTGKMPREDQQPLSATDKKAILEADEMVLSNQSAIDAFKQAKGLSKQAYYGPTAGIRGYATSLVGNEGGVATEELNNLIMSNALSQLKATFGGAPTEGERKVLLDIQGSVNKPDEVRQKIYDRAILLAEKRMEFNRKRAEELRGGTFYKQGGSQPATASKPQGVIKWELGPDGNPRPVQQ